MADPRWVLAYSEQCGSCTRVADGIAELAAGRLETRGLLDPDVIDWRRLTGHANDWQPILFLLSEGPAEGLRRTSPCGELCRASRPPLHEEVLVLSRYDVSDVIARAPRLEPTSKARGYTRHLILLLDRARSR